MPSVSLCDSEDTAQLRLAVLLQGGGPCVGLHDEGGQLRIFLTLLDDTYLVVTDAKNRKVWTVPKPGRKK